MHTWVCGIFGVNFEAKKALRSSRLVLAFRSHGLTGCKLGAVQIRFPVWRELKQERTRCGLTVATFVQIRFPVWRELKLHLVETRYYFLDEFRYAFPFEGNWNQKLLPFIPATIGSDTLSRLKGIETFLDYIVVRSSLVVQIRFPVWRELKPTESGKRSSASSVQIRFPVWRELKLSGGLLPSFVRARSDTLSRLKGIETLPSRRWWCRQSVQIRFPVWRELKHSLLRLIFSFSNNCSDTLSRLKGIETASISNIMVARTDTVQIRFPVWRELKRYQLKFPVLVVNEFRYAFPFEGNWNAPLNPISVGITGSDTLSRLKGIETGS